MATITEVSSIQKIFRWDGSQWLPYTMKTYDGATWITPIVKVWTGTEWKIVQQIV